MHRGAFDDKKLKKKKKLRARLGYEIHVETIAISTDSLGNTYRETISTRNSIAIINHFLLNSLNCFIIATKTYICLYVYILWSDLESSRMCLWNKIPIPPFGARSNVYFPCISILRNREGQDQFTFKIIFYLFCSFAILFQNGQTIQLGIKTFQTI